VIEPVLANNIKKKIPQNLQIKNCSFHIATKNSNNFPPLIPRILTLRHVVAPFLLLPLWIMLLLLLVVVFLMPYFVLLCTKSWGPDRNSTEAAVSSIPSSRSSSIYSSNSKSSST